MTMLRCWVPLLTLALTAANAQEDVTVCYFQTLSFFREKGFHPNHLNSMDKAPCTHLVYASARINNSAEAIAPRLDVDIIAGGYDNTTSLKKKFPDMKITLSVGGRFEGTERFTRLCSNVTKRKMFIDSTVVLLKKHKFDGLDIDWEYPTHRGGVPKDKENFVLLVKELKTEFANHNLILTATLSATKSIIDSSYNLPELAKYVDLFHLKTFNYYSSRLGKLWPSGPLKDNTDENIDSTVQYIVSLGVPPKKLILGIPLSGLPYIMKTDEVPQISVTNVTSSTFQGPYTRMDGMIGYFEICQLSDAEDWKNGWDQETATAFIYKDTKAIAYDSQRSIMAKVRYAVNEKLGGVMVWSIDYDDYDAVCKFDLINVYDDFEKRLSDLKRNETFISGIDNLKLPNATEEYSSTIKFSDPNLYRIVNGDVTLMIPQRRDIDYPLMRTISEAFILSRQEMKLLEAFDPKGPGNADDGIHVGVYVLIALTIAIIILTIGAIYFYYRKAHIKKTPKKAEELDELETFR